MVLSWIVGCDDLISQSQFYNIMEKEFKHVSIPKVTVTAKDNFTISLAKYLYLHLNKADEKQKKANVRLSGNVSPSHPNLVLFTVYKHLEI